MYRLSRLHLFYITSGACLLLSPFYGAIEGNPNTFKVSKEICSNGAIDETVNSTCCQPIRNDDLITRSCMVTSKLGEKNISNNEAVIRLSVFVECVYSKRKFIRTYTQLHIRHIKAEAKKLYPDDKQRRNFMVNMYRDCGEQATKVMEHINSDPEQEKFFKDLHKPYFVNVFMCVSLYSLHKCPYFEWNPSFEFCQKRAAECKMLESSIVKKSPKEEEGE